MTIYIIFLALILLGVFIAYRVNHVSPLMESLIVVSFNEAEITVNNSQGLEQKVEWNTLTKIDILTTDDGPMQADVFWRFFTDNDEAELIFSGGAMGEQEMLVELQKRLATFNDEALIRAMGSTNNAQFTLWTLN